MGGGGVSCRQHRTIVIEAMIILYSYTIGDVIPGNIMNSLPSFVMSA